MEKFCRECGKPLEDGVKFCTECGAPVLEEAAPQQAPQPQQPAQPQQSYGYAGGGQQPPVAAPAAPQQPTYQPQYGQQPPQQQYQQPQYQQPSRPQYNQPQYNQQPQYQQPPRPQYNQPQYGQQPPQQPYQPQYQQPQYGQQPAPAPAAPKKKKTWLIPVIIVLVLAIGAGAFFALRGGLGGKGIGDDYAALCDMTSVGTQSYLYARLLTEQLIGTDVATAEPDEISKLFTECLSAWKATESASGKISSMAEALSSDKRLGSLDASRASGSVFVTTALAAGEAAQMAETLSAAESVGRCGTLAAQLQADAAVGLSRVQDMQRVYSGRATSMLDWDNVAENAATGFSAVVFLSGSVNGGTRSVRTLSTGLKAGSLAIDGADILVDVGSTGSCIVAGQGSGVTLNQDEVRDYLPGGGSSVISINTYPEDPAELGITFHANGLALWFVIDRVGGFTITRGNKDGGNGVSEPNVTGVTVDPNGMDEGDIRDTLEQNGVTLPPPGSGSVTDFLPPAGNSSDIQQTIDRISGENTGSQNSGSTTPAAPTAVNGETLTIRRGEEGAGSGDITVSMLWGTADDLDLHMNTPDGGHIYYGNRDAGGGTLDVDMNAHDIVASPIENIYFPTPADGHYKIYIRDYRDRTDGQSTHYLVRVVINGQERTFEGDIDATGTEITILEFDYLGPETSSEPPAPTEESMNSLLNAAGAGQGDITVSLAWNTIDDVDLHIINPDESHIYYSNRSTGGGTLDVDANAGSQRITDPVENIYYAAPSNGHYRVYIHEFNDRSEGTTDYMVRVTIGGESQVFRGTIDSTGTDIEIIEFDYGGATGGLGDSTFGGHSYAYYEGSMSWTEARAYCQTMGGHLVTITSAEEQAFLEATYPGTQGWIGCYGDGSTWNWVTGEAWDYTNWNSGEPNNQHGDEWFGHLYSGMHWNDLNNEDTGHYHSGFYCEWDTMSDLNESTLNEGLENAGALSGEITISVTWDSEDDIDLHVFTPNGNRIYWGDTAWDGGVLDVDANSDEDDLSTSPVENIYFAEPINGEYWVYIMCYSDRTPDRDTNYLVRVTVGEDSQVYRGTINGDDEALEIVGFQYNGASD